MIDENELIKQLIAVKKQNKSNCFDRLNEGFERAINIVRQQPRMNTIEFKHFKLHSDSTLKSMTKDELIRYIHTLYHNWSATDDQLRNVIKYANTLQDKVEYYKHEYYSECDRAEKLEELLSRIEE